MASSLFVSNSFAQETKRTITLEEVLERAKSKSLEAFMQKHIYLSEYWSYRSFKADRLPTLDLSLTPIEYNQAFVKRYNSVTDQDEYREQNTLNSFARLSLTQNIDFSGGKVYIDSDLSRLENFGSTNFTSYSSTPIRIGLIQPIFSSNPFKWEKKIAPIKYQKAQKEYLLEMQEINIYGTQLFFQLMKAQKEEEMAAVNYKNAQDLVAIGEKRFAIASINKNDLLNLKLNVLDMEIAYTQAQKNRKQIQFDLHLFLGWEDEKELQLILPEQLHITKIDGHKALSLAQFNHPSLLEYQQMRLEAERDVEESKRARHFQANLTASYGLNQENPDLDKAYKNPLNQSTVQVGIQIPILDWGKRKGLYEMAKSKREAVELSIKQQERNFLQDVSRKVNDFNLQQKIIRSNYQASRIADDAYQLTLKLFKEGKSSVLELNSAITKQSMAQQNYIQSLEDYWTYYYGIQKLTLFNFIREEKLKEDFSRFVESTPESHE